MRLNTFCTFQPRENLHGPGFTRAEHGFFAGEGMGRDAGAALGSSAASRCEAAA